MRTTNIGSLEAALRESWSRSTSADSPRWSPNNPAWGQCAVTALLVQDLLGGELLRGVVDGVSHYFNRLPDGSLVDLTREQFGSGAEVRDTAIRARAYVLGFAETRQRYRRLRRAVASRLRETGGVGVHFLGRPAA